MKKSIVLAVLALGAMSATAQGLEQPKFFDNWSIGLDGGVTTPLTHHAFFGSMRGLVGLHVDKQVTPAFKLGVEGQFAVNTSSWKEHMHSATAFDHSYVGTYGAVDLMNFFGGFKEEGRPFTIEVVAGAGWGRRYMNPDGESVYNNFFATKAGLNFNFNVSKKLTISLKPYVLWDMTDSPEVNNTTCSYNANRATFNLQAGLTYHFGEGFKTVRPYNQAEIDALNGQINDLRSQLDACNANANAWQNKAEGLANELAACMSRKPEVVKEVNNNLNSVRYVFYRIGSAAITADQMPNVEMIASYLKNHKDSKVVVKGYASQDGNLDNNVKLAKNRAEAVKTALVNKYKIAADRITADGEGIGHMFSEDSWNRVSICTIEDAK